MSGGLALITGASSGIGAAFARRLAADGHDLLLVARRAARLAELAAELHARHAVAAAALPADLSTLDGIDSVRRRIIDGPPLALLVNSAGFGTRGLFVEVEEQRTQAMVQLQAVAPVQLTRAALPAMLAAGRGRIILVSSLGGFFTTARYVTYSATKACINTFCEGLQAELSGTGVRAQAICPGLIRTEFFDGPDFANFRYQQVPSWVWMTAEQVVDETLASRETIFIPGRHFRAFAQALRTPLLGPALRWTLAKLNRDGLY
jgi:hypothetical protein